MRKLAVFDVDGTIFRSSLTRRLFSYLVREGIFPQKARKEVEKDFKAWLDRKGGYDPYIAKVVKIFEKYIKGKNQKDIRRLSRNIIAQEKLQTYRFTRDLVKDLKKKDYFLVAISGSPFEIVRWYNRVLKFDKSYGWVLETDKKGRYTGEAKYEYSFSDKKFLVDHVLDKYKVTLKGSIGVGDSKSDVPFLNLVDNPIAFNPSSGLYKIAKRKGWEVVVERKDVIYKI